jgi:hypothetical protein
VIQIKMPYNHQNSYNSQKRKRLEVKIKNTMTQKEVKLSPINEPRVTVPKDNQEITDDEKDIVNANKKDN